jgi:hypothetical protein
MKEDFFWNISQGTDSCWLKNVSFATWLQGYDISTIDNSYIVYKYVAVCDQQISKNEIYMHHIKNQADMYTNVVYT